MVGAGVGSVNSRDWCSLATIVLIGAGQLSHPCGGIKGRSSHDRGRFVSNSFCRCHISIQTSIHPNYHPNHEHFERFRFICHPFEVCRCEWG